MQTHAAHASAFDDERCERGLFDDLNPDLPCTREQTGVHLRAAQTQRLPSLSAKPCARHRDAATRGRIEDSLRHTRAAPALHLFEHAETCKVLQTFGRDELTAQLLAREALA